MSDWGWWLAAAAQLWETAPYQENIKILNFKDGFYRRCMVFTAMGTCKITEQCKLGTSLEEYAYDTYNRYIGIHDQMHCCHY
jgi:hypothetical protein